MTRADSLYTARQRDSAAALGQAALRIAEAQYGPVDTNVAHILNRLGTYTSNINTDTSEAYFLRAKLLWEQIPGSNPLNYSRTLNNLGNMAKRVGRYEEAIQLYEQSLVLKQKVLPANDTGLAVPYFNLSGVAIGMGRYSEAEQYLRQASEIWTLAGVPLGPGVYLHRSIVYRRQYRYDESIAAARESIRLYLKGGDAWLAVAARGNLASSLLAIGKLEEARDLFLENIQFCDTYPDLKSNLRISFARVTHRIDLGQTDRLLRNFHEAEAYLNNADSLIRADFPVSFGDEYRLLYELGRLYYDTHQLDRALETFNASLRNADSVLVDMHPRLVAVLQWLARTHLALGNPQAALPPARRAADISYQVLPSMIAGVPENDALAYANDAAAAAAVYFESLRRLPNVPEEESTWAIDLILRTKGATSDLLIQRRRELELHADQATRKLRERRSFAAEQLSRHLLDRRPGAHPDSSAKIIDSLQREYQQACADLALKDASVLAQDQLRSVSAADIQRALQPGAVAVEMLAVQLDSSEMFPHYALVVIGQAAPRLTWLLESEVIDSLVDEYSSHMQSLARLGHAPGKIEIDHYAAISRSLYQLILAPVLSSQETVTSLLLAPAGKLGLISFGGLMAPDGAYLLEHTELHALDALREVIRPRASVLSGEGILLVGDPDFDATLPEQPTALTKATIASRGSAMAVRGTCTEFLDSLMDPLPETRTEVQGIADHCEKHFASVGTLLGHEASEDNVKRLAPGSSVLHLATHGFSLSANCGKEKASETSLPPAERNPLLTSGLLLAGARHSLLNPRTRSGEDGILSALEVAELDLPGTQLVTLSACESGLGTLHQSEGLYGLRRAFSLAGVQAVMAALWSLPDQTTSEIMQSFYRHWSGHKGEALRASQLEWIEAQRAAGFPDHPFLWAGLVLYEPAAADGEGSRR